MTTASTLAAFEHVFDTGVMSVARAPSTIAAEAMADARALTEKLSQKLGIPTATALLEQTRPRRVDPALAGLFAQGGLPPGEVVGLSGRHVLSLALACCAAVTRDGGWCAGIGLGDASVAAIEGFGIDLSRFVSLDTPGQDWMRVTSILTETFAVLIVKPGFSASAGDRARIAAKLRESRTTLLLLDPSSTHTDSTKKRMSFPGSSEHLTVLDESWEGLEQGAGRLRERTLHLRSARTGRHTLVLPDSLGRPAAITSDVPAGTLRVIPGAGAS